MPVTTAPAPAALLKTANAVAGEAAASIGDISGPVDDDELAPAEGVGATV